MPLTQAVTPRATTFTAVGEEKGEGGGRGNGRVFGPDDGSRGCVVKRMVATSLWLPGDRGDRMNESNGAQLECVVEARWVLELAWRGPCRAGAVRLFITYLVSRRAGTSGIGRRGRGITTIHH